MREPKKFSLECVSFTQHTVPMGGQHRSVKLKGRRHGKNSDLPYMGEAALDDFLRWIEGVNPPPSMVAIPVPISFGAVPTTAWCSPADAAVLRCRLDYHAAETSFRDERKHVRYVYNDVSSAANRPRTVSPRKCGRVLIFTKFELWTTRQRNRRTKTRKRKKATMLLQRSLLSVL